MYPLQRVRNRLLSRDDDGGWECPSGAREDGCSQRDGASGCGRAAEHVAQVDAPEAPKGDMRFMPSASVAQDPGSTRKLRVGSTRSNTVCSALRDCARRAKQRVLAAPRARHLKGAVNISGVAVNGQLAVPLVVNKSPYLG